MAALIPFLLIAPSMAFRTTSNKSSALNADTSYLSGNSPLKCSSFESSAAGSCNRFLDDDEARATLVSRAEALIYDMAQTQRFLADYLTPTSSVFAKLWHGSKLGSSKADRSFLAGATTHLSEIQDLTQKPAKEVRSKLPAGSMPLIVEVWNRGNVASFLGEAGVPLRSDVYHLPLQSNKHRGSTIAQGSVTVQTVVTMSAVQDCKKDGGGDVGSKCRNIKFSASCSLGSSSSYAKKPQKPYCKFRMRESALSQQQKITFPPREDSNEFAFEWEAYAFQPLKKVGDPDVPVDLYVPWTLDEQTVLEQSHATVYFLAKTVFMNADRCSRSSFRWACTAIEKFGTMTIDKEEISNLQTLAEEGTSGLASSRQDKPAPAALLQESQDSGSGNPIFVAAIVGAQNANRNAGVGYSGGGSGGDGPGPLSWLLVASIFIIIIIAAVA